jgi:predicted nucleic acid-binding protein
VPEKPVFILDTFALLAYLQDEPTAPRVQRILEDCEKGRCRSFLSLINLGEVLYLTERRGGISRAQDTLALIQSLPVEIVPADSQNVFAAAHIKANYSISYADSFAVAAALEQSAIVLTGDPEFKDVEEIVKVEWLAQ